MWTSALSMSSVIVITQCGLRDTEKSGCPFQTPVLSFPHSTIYASWEQALGLFCSLLSAQCLRQCLAHCALSEWRRSKEHIPLPHGCTVPSCLIPLSPIAMEMPPREVTLWFLPIIYRALRLFPESRSWWDWIERENNTGVMRALKWRWGRNAEAKGNLHLAHNFTYWSSVRLSFCLMESITWELSFQAAWVTVSFLFWFLDTKDICFWNWRLSYSVVMWKPSF